MSKSPEQYSPEEISDLEAQRRVSDKELMDEGAEVVEGKLKITPEQYKHLQKTMEAELDIIKSNESRNLLAKMQHCIGTDIRFLQPEVQQEIVKTLKALLKLSKIDPGTYLMDLVTIFSDLEKSVGPKMPPMGLHETKLAATFFGELKDDERRIMEDYIEHCIKKQTTQTLEQYMAEQLGFETKESYNPDEAQHPEGKRMLAQLAAFNSDNIEDFTINIPKGKEIHDESKLVSIVRSYYESIGFEVSERNSSIMAKKEGNELLISVSNYEDIIMVSVVPFRG